MSRKSELLSTVLESDVPFQIDLLKYFFSEKRISVLIRTETLTFQTEVAAVLTNNAKFAQAKGKTREEAQKLAVRKAWEKVIAKGKDGDFGAVIRKLGEGKNGAVGTMCMNASPPMASSRTRRNIASAPMSPSEQAEFLAGDSSHPSAHLDSLIVAAARAVGTSSPSVPRKPSSQQSSVRKSFPTEIMFRSLFRPKRIASEDRETQKRALHTAEREEIPLIDRETENEDRKKQARRFQYRSLADARFEMKMKRVSLSLAGCSRDGEDMEKYT